MATHYSNPKRETDPHALPNVETFYVAEEDIADAYADAETDEDGEEAARALGEPGWYYWFCFPGCLPDSDPCGPFETEAEALADARALMEEEDEDNA